MQSAGPGASTRDQGNGKTVNRTRTLIGSVAATSVGSAIFLATAPGILLTGTPSAVAIGLGAIGIASTLLASRKKRAVEGSTVTALTVDNQISEELREKIAELHGLAEIYEERKSPLFAAVNGVLANVQELFERMATRTDEQSARIAGVRYTDTLTKLNEALGRSYYLDIEAHPELWSDPDERMEAVETAVNATGEQVLRNIRELNSSRDLIYQLSLESLVNRAERSKGVPELGIE